MIYPETKAFLESGDFSPEMIGRMTDAERVYYAEVRLRQAGLLEGKLSTSQQENYINRKG